MKTKIFEVPIYFGKLKVIQTNDIKSIVEQYGFEKYVETCPAFVFSHPKKNGASRWIAVFRKDVDNSIVAHETVHVVNLIFKDRGIELDVDNDEAQAYLTGWVFGKISKALK